MCHLSYFISFLFIFLICGDSLLAYHNGAITATPCPKKNTVPFDVGDVNVVIVLFRGQKNTTNFIHVS